MVSGKEISDGKQIANALNDYFANVGNNLASNIPTCTKSFKDYLKDPNPHSIFLQPTASEERIKEIDKMKNKKSALDIFKISMIKYSPSPGSCILGSSTHPGDQTKPLPKYTLHIAIYKNV